MDGPSGALHRRDLDQASVEQEPFLFGQGGFFAGSGPRRRSTMLILERISHNWPSYHEEGQGPAHDETIAQTDANLRSLSGNRLALH